MPFYVRGVRGRQGGLWDGGGAKLNLHPTWYACLRSPAMLSAGGRQNLSPSSGNYSELVRHVWYLGLHLPFIWCIYILGFNRVDGGISKSLCMGVCCRYRLILQHFKDMGHLGLPRPVVADEQRANNSEKPQIKAKIQINQCFQR